MIRRKRNVLVAVAACVVLAASVHSARAQGFTPIVFPLAQNAAPAGTTPTDAIALKVEVVLTRSQGAKKVSSLPYTLVVPAVPITGPQFTNPGIQPQGPNASLRLGVDVFTGRTLSTTNDGKVSSSPEYQYIGTNIDCRADYRTPGTYRVYLTLSDTSLASATAEAGSAAGPSGVRRFSASNTLTVRDGQPGQFTVGTDPLTGETIRVDVTATATK